MAMQRPALPHELFLANRLVEVRSWLMHTLIFREIAGG